MLTLILCNVDEGSILEASTRYLSFGTCYEFCIEQLCTSGIHKYNLYILSCLSDFVRCRRSTNFQEMVLPLLHVNATVFFSKDPFLVTKASLVYFISLAQ